MHTITKDISLKIDGQEVSFRLTKLDAFSGVALLRLLMRLEDERNKGTVPDVLLLLLRPRSLPKH